VSATVVNKVVLAYGLNLRYRPPPRATIVCKICSREYRPISRTLDGICVRRHRATTSASETEKRETGTKNRPEVARDPSTEDQLFRLLEQSELPSQAEAARRLGVSRQRISRIVLAYGLNLRAAPARRWWAGRDASTARDTSAVK
jgi:hypothetical protein